MAPLIPANMMPLALAALFMFALAAWLLWLDIGKTVNRVFAALLGLRATTFVIAIMRNAEWSGPGVDHELTLLAQYAALPLFPVSVYFLSVYPRRRWLGAWRYGGVATAAFTFAALLWYSLDAAAYGPIVRGVSNSFNAVGSSASGFIYDPLGPLSTFNGLRLLTWSVIGLVLAWDYAHAKQGAGRNAVFLVMMGFVLNSLHDGMRELIQRIDELDDLAQTPMLPWTWGQALLPLASLLPAIGAVAVIGWFGLRHADRGPRKTAVAFLAACTLPIFTAYMIEAKLGMESLRLFVLSVWRLFVPIFVTYALLRYGIFDIDLKVKAGVRRAAILAVFGLTFFVVFEAAEALVSEGRGMVFGLVAAGVLATANRPIERLAHHAAERMMPDTKPLDQLTLREKHDLYVHQLELVMQDEGISAKERRMLQELASALGFSADETMALERGERPAVDEAPVHAPRERPRSSAVLRAGLVALTTAAVFGVVSQGLEFMIPLNDQQTGLLTSAIVALSLGGIEKLAARITHRQQTIHPAHEQTLRAALREAWSDGVLSARDKQFLGQLETELHILPGQRLRIERQVRRELGHRRFGIF